MTSAYLVADETLVNRKKNIYIEKYKATGGQQDCSALTAETLFCIWKPDNFFFIQPQQENETLSSETSFENKLFKSLK